ncbi:hypothetical protein QL285_046743 [Trifolium repens]|nr:hypothetical protein QL285_046743 [Trifolium repens]
MSHDDQNQPQAVAYDDQTSKDTLVGPYLIPPPAIINKGYSQNVPPKREIKFKGSVVLDGVASVVWTFASEI